jgi:DNA-binding transcriptional LysR family regulator
MNLDRLRIFQVVCEERSVSRAAVRLFRTQPAISMQLASLEAEAGTRLLTRSSRGVSPTSSGQRLLACAAEVFRAHERLREAWTGTDVAGDLYVAASDTVARHFLPPILRDLVRRRPGVRLHLVQSATPESQNRLGGGEVDVAFMLRPVADPRFGMETVLRYRHVAACAPSRGRPISSAAVDPAELARGPLVLLPRGTQTRHLVDEAFRAKGIVPGRVLEVGSVSIQKEMVRCGLGIGILPSYAVERRDRLRTRPIAGASVREIAVAWRADLPLTGTAEAFLALVRAEAARRGRRHLSDAGPRSA